MPTKWGMFGAIGFERDIWNGGQKTETALALVMGGLSKGVPLLRIHLECFMGHALSLGVSLPAGAAASRQQAKSPIRRLVSNNLARFAGFHWRRQRMRLK